MACTWASKVNGILTVVAVGIAVLIDLWDILDYKKDNSMASLHAVICNLIFAYLHPSRTTLLDNLPREQRA